ncbi:MAG: GIY-YIG nuclease family protein [Flavobacteriaceae bacterium]
MKSYFVYILRCADDSYYTGITSDLEKRLMQHNEGKTFDGYTLKRRPVTLVWYQEFNDPNQAISWEKRIKRWRRNKKEALIRNEFELLSELSKNYTEYGKPNKA